MVPAVKPRDDEANKPRDDEANKPPDDETNKPPDDETNKPPDDKTNKPPDDKTNKPGDDEKLYHLRCRHPVPRHGVQKCAALQFALRIMVPAVKPRDDKTNKPQGDETNSNQRKLTHIKYILQNNLKTN